MPDEQLGADLELSIDQALSNVEALGSALSSELDSASSSFSESMASAISAVPDAEVAVDADASGVEPAITAAVDAADTEVTVDADAESIEPAISAAVDSADSTVAVEADTSSAVDLLDSFIASAEAEAPVITVEADTGEAQESIADLGSTAESAGSQVSGAGGDVSNFSGLADVATGSVSGLGNVIGGLGGRAAASAGLIGAAGASVAVMFNEAVDATGATQRFSAALGDQADRVENLRNIEGLNTNLGDLALTLGSDDDKIRTVASRMFELSSASGKTKDESALFVQQLVAMGARAVALNPELGDLGDVTDGLSTALVRGGRFASKYNLDLNQTEINSRALRDTNKSSTAELSFVEKAMAGASIASEKYGDNLATVIAQGSENAITKQRRLKQIVVENIEALGMPLVAPIFELMEAGIPVVENVGRVLATLGQSALPVVTAAASVLAPVLGVVADILENVPAPVLAAVAAFVLFRSPASEAGGLLRSLGGEAMSTSDKIGRIVVGTGLAVTGLQSLTDGSGKTEEGILSLVGAGASLGSIWGPQGAAIGAFAGLVVGLGAAMIGGGESVEHYRNEFTKLGTEIEGASAKAAAADFVDKLGFDDFVKLAAGGKDAIRGISDELTALAKGSPAAADQVLKGLRAMRDDAGKPIFTGAEFDALESAIDKGTAAYQRHAQRAKEAQETDQHLAETQVTVSEELAQSASTFDNALAASVRYSQGVETAADLTAALSAADQELRNELDLLFGRFLSADQATNAYKLSVIDLGAKLYANAFAFDDNSKAGLENRDALDDLASKAINAGEAIFKSTGSVEQARQPLIDFRGTVVELRDKLAAAGQDTSFLDGILANTDAAIAGVGGKEPDAETAGKKLGGGLSTGLDAMRDTVADAGSGLGYAAANAANAVQAEHERVGQELGGALVGGVLDKIGDAVSAGTSVAAGSAQGSVSVAPYHKVVGDVLGANVAGGILGGVSGAFGAGREVGGAGASGAGGLWGSYYAAGQSSAQGLIAGIQSIAGEVAAAAAGVASGAVSAVRGVFDSASPSKVFRDIGHDVGDGLIIGLDESGPAVGRAGAAMARSALDSIDWDALGRYLDSLSGQVIHEDDPRWQWWSMGNGRAGADYAAAHPQPASLAPIAPNIPADRAASTQTVEFNIQVHGVSDPRQARIAGEQLADAAAEGLTRRGIVMRARVG